jgi:hypothetical protein
VVVQASARVVASGRSAPARGEVVPVAEPDVAPPPSRAPDRPGGPPDPTAHGHRGRIGPPPVVRRAPGARRGRPGRPSRPGGSPGGRTRSSGRSPRGARARGRRLRPA